MTITLNQTGLTAGTSDRSRSDGLATGALIQITSSVSSSVTMLWRPDEDTSSTLSAIDSTHWQLTPPAGVYGTYLFSDATSGVRRTFSIRTKNRGLRIPALNEAANSSGSLLNNGAAYIFTSNFNEASGSGPFSAGNYGGWYSALRETILAVDNVASSDNAASYLVLNATASLANERAFTAGTGIQTTDGGAGGNYTVSINNNIVATISGSCFTGVVTASAGIFAQGLQLTASAPPSDQIVVKGWTAITVTGSIYFMPLFQ